MIHAIDEDGRYLFGPARVEAPAGGTVVVMAFGQEPHSVVADSGERWVPIINATETRTFTAPTALGEHGYRCAFHPEMVGTLVVTAARAATPTPEAKDEAPGLPAVAVVLAVALLALVRRR